MRAASVLGALAVGAYAVGLASVAAGDTPEDLVVARITDPELTESSGLVVTDEGWVSVNDSGDTGRLFVLDPRTGGRLRTVPFAEDVVDVEALAPAGPGAVWAGDVGDNRHARDHVTLYRVPLDGGPVRTVDAVHPDGPRDAEALLTHPGTGDVYVVTKEVLGGTLSLVPGAGDGSAPTDGPVRLEPVGPVTGVVTDGAFFPDGRHLVLRTYARAVVYAWPSLEMVADLDLPEQKQGEAVAVVDGGRSLLLTSEGIEAPVLRFPLPADVRRTLRGAPSDEAGATDGPTDDARPEADDADATAEDGRTSPWWWLALPGAALVAAGLLALRRRR